MPTQTHRHSPLLHLTANLEHLALLVQEHDINRELHPDGMYAFTRHNPQAFAGGEPDAAQQSAVARGGRIGDVGPICKGSVPGLVSHTQF